MSKEMEKLIPLSKSTYSVWQKCPWKAYAYKVLGLRRADTKQAFNGREAHDLRVQIQSGATDIASALATASSQEVGELTAKSIANSLYPEIQDEKHEQYYHNEYVHGYVDRVGRLSGKLFVEDLKTGRFESDDVVERDIYSVLVWDHEATPDESELLFVRFFCRSGNHDEFHYSRNDIEAARQNIIRIVNEVRNSDPEPNPGDHCLNWYGRPCEFLGDQCPLAKDVPTLVESAVPVGLQEVGKAFMSIYQGGLSIDDINSHTASLALQGVHQLKAASKMVEETLKNWADSKGPIEVGGARYGWQSVADYEVDKSFALEAMFRAGMQIDEVANVVNLSKTTIEKMSKRKYGEVRDTILTMGVNKVDGGKRKFGKIK